jgi:hypothetical protein
MLSNQVGAPLFLVPAAKCPSYPLGFLKQICHRQYQFRLTAFLPAPGYKISEKDRRFDFSNAWLLWRPLGTLQVALCFDFFGLEMRFSVPLSPFFSPLHNILA